MSYGKLEYSREDVNRSGKLLLSQDKLEESNHVIDIVDNWRAAHAYPTQVIFVTLKRRAESIFKGAQVGQRIKRLPSIIKKLEKEKEMKLSQMQDIGGCRVILNDIQQVYRLQEKIESSRWKHEKLQGKNYIKNPKNSGYRGIHLRYRYRGEGSKSGYNGLKVEIQIRTMLQHVWATAVEAAEVFTQQEIKASRGKPEWERFFALMGSVFALWEKCPLVPETPNSYDDLCLEIKNLCEKYNIVNLFIGYANAIKITENKVGKSDYYCLIILDPVAKRVGIRRFKKKEYKLANAAYIDAERNKSKEEQSQIVLVSVSSIKSLKRIYPNYFLDTKKFVTEVTKVVKDRVS
ncbi:MAG: RelA/SpoT domain-containing protein [Azoarcus sp.]|jgi:hypothetical protein|nr:RelA/SpoT domain-containing protein [Azoarcus sp.]